MQNKDAQRNSILMVVILICTITIILTNYVFTKNIVTDLNNTLIENEYTKIGGKENYLIMQEIQRREIIGYIDKVKEEQPELIQEILDLHKDIKDIKKYKTLNQDIINDLKKDTFISGNSGALISLIEFSDLECPFCIKQHLDGVNKKAFKNFSGSLNYIFKNFPLPTHKNSSLESEAAKCVESLKGGEKYLEYIDLIFNNTDGGGEGFKIENLGVFAEKISVNKDDFEKCMVNRESKDKVEREFKQGVMLGINSVPSTLIVNNDTGKYIIISETINYESLEKIVKSFN